MAAESIFALFEISFYYLYRYVFDPIIDLQTMAGKAISCRRIIYDRVLFVLSRSPFTF